MNKLIQHALPATGLAFTQAPTDLALQVGEYIHLVTRDVAALPERLQLYLRDQDEVARLYETLRDQTIQA